jgi:hypothetical protein
MNLKKLWKSGRGNGAPIGVRGEITVMKLLRELNRLLAEPPIDASREGKTNRGGQ